MEENAGKNAEDQSIAGTGFKTQEELATGYLNLQKKLGEQGNELGTVKKAHESLSKQAETLATILKENLTKGQPAKEEVKAVDYGAELVAVEKQIQELDPVSDDYQKSLAALVAKSNKLVAQATKEDVLKASHAVFTKELSDRDVKAAHQKFKDDNPTFDTEEMQAKIQEYITKDKTGMSDPLSAFREIQRDEIAIEVKRLSDENAEYKKRLNLAKGTEETGKVIVKGQAAGQPTQHTKATGKDLDAGMAAILKAQRT